ncbi:MAG: helix-turn-helix transcriptional regulator [Clostridia bacterium]|jgi:transcriptional regulator with XRE-family HTH domain|nr:helix-turn-helix transcriptional regulator [Clostridia bacterium]
MSGFSEQLQSLIAESGKSQNQISAELGIRKQKLSKWKRGYNEPNISELILIARYFGVTVDYLVGAGNDGAL